MITVKYKNNSQILIKSQQRDSERNASEDVKFLARKIELDKFVTSKSTSHLNRILKTKNQESFCSILYVNSFSDRISTDSIRMIRIAHLKIIENIQLRLHEN